jgi:hypothetical protein
VVRIVRVPRGILRRALLHLRDWHSFLRGRLLPTGRVRLSALAQGYPTIDELVHAVRTQANPAFLFEAAERNDYVDTWHSEYGRSLKDAVKQADMFCHNRFRLLGREMRFPDGINWHLDPDSGDVWPPLFVEKMERYVASGMGPGDYKLPWELGRHQHLVALGKAYWLTGDEKYARKCASHVRSWIEQNPVGRGIHWCSSLEIGLRLINWSLAFHFLRTSEAFAESVGEVFLKSLWQQRASGSSRPSCVSTSV